MTFSQLIILRKKADPPLTYECPYGTRIAEKLETTFKTNDWLLPWVLSGLPVGKRRRPHPLPAATWRGPTAQPRRRRRPSGGSRGGTEDEETEMTKLCWPAALAARCCRTAGSWTTICCCWIAGSPLKVFLKHFIVLL